MAYVTVPKDLTKIKSKMLFGLTKRQLVCFGSAALVGVPLFFLSKGSMGTTPAALCMILVMLPFFLFALYEKNGQTPEALLGNLIQCKFTRPKKRVYQTNNAYSALEKQAELERTVGRIASGAGKRGKGRRRLTRQERKQIEAVIRQARGDGKNHTVQASLPFRNMHPDGLCRLDDRHFSKTIAYADVSYRLAGPDDQRDIFERLCDFYNGYDPSIGVQMTLSSSHKAGGGDLFRMAAQGDELDGIRAEASGILQTQYERGSNGYVKSKYVTLTIEAENIQAARARFSRIEADTLNRFKVMGAAAKVLDGKERLALLHGLLHPRGEPFAFEWDWLAPSGLSVKDFIAPSSFEFGETRRFRMGEMYGAVSFLQILAPEIQDRILTDFMDVEGNLLVTMHVRGINQNEAIKMVKRKITDLDAMKIQEQKKAARSGYDLDILPSDLSTYGGAAKNLLQDLQSRNERMFNMTFLMLHLAPTKQKLEIAVSQSASVAQTHNCILTRLDFQQEDGLMSSLPLGLNRIQIERSLTTSALAVFVPFVTQELFMGGDAMYYGLNALSGNMILLDRKQSRCPNGLVFGTPGSGKSMSCKREITYVMLTTKDNVIICDPEDEYSPLVNRLGGQVIRLSPNSRDYVNPLDSTRDYRFEPLDAIRNNGLSVKPENYELVYEAPLTAKDDLESIYTRFNVDRPADFTGHSLSVSDIVVLHQGGKDTAHYCDRAGFSEVPEFLQPAQKSLDITERIQTPRGSFYLCGMTREQMEADGYGFHHASEDGKYLIMANGTQAYAVRADAPEKDNPLRTAEMTLEDDYGMIDGVINNGRRGEELEKAREHAERTQPEKKPSIRERLAAAKQECAKQQPRPAPEKKPPELGER